MHSVQSDSLGLGSLGRFSIYKHLPTTGTHLASRGGSKVRVLQCAPMEIHLAPNFQNLAKIVAEATHWIYFLAFLAVDFLLPSLSRLFFSLSLLLSLGCGTRFLTSSIFSFKVLGNWLTPKPAKYLWLYFSETATSATVAVGPEER